MYFDVVVVGPLELDHGALQGQLPVMYSVLVVLVVVLVLVPRISFRRQVATMVLILRGPVQRWYSVWERGIHVLREGRRG